MDDGNSFEIPLSSFPPVGYQRPSAERPAFIERLRAEVRGMAYRPAARRKSELQLPDPDAARRIFTVETGSRWMDLGEREPAAKMLFGEFWHQGELCIMFADTNAGKSVLAVQIANNIARAKPTGPFACQAKPERVLYVDFELSTTQFYQRYSHPEGDHEFPANFYRAQFNPANVPDYFKGYDDFLIAGLEQKILQIKATVLIIDNISCLRGGTESAAVALRLMNSLKHLKADHKLSILVLAHTPKRRNPARPISPDDLHGSKLLINFADSAFAIGKSATEAGLCYIKQIKQRNTQQIYGEDNVALGRICKTPFAKNKPGNFLHFGFEGYDAERPHIQIAGRHGYNRAETNHDELATQITQLAAGGLSQRQIARRLYLSVGTVNRLMNRQNDNEAALSPPVGLTIKIPVNHDDMTPVPVDLRHGSRHSGMIAQHKVSRLKSHSSNLKIDAGVPLRSATRHPPKNDETAMSAYANGPP